MSPLRHLLALVLLTTTVAALAQDPADRRRSIEGQPAEAWREQAVQLPDYPSDDDLLYLKGDFLDERYRYLVDRASLSVGEEDNVIRYTIVIEPLQGSRHVLYEGLRCSPSVARVYAIASGRIFRPREGETWGRIPEEGPFAYRRLLSEDVACDTAGQPRAAGDVLRLLGGPPARGPRFERVPSFYD